MLYFVVTMAKETVTSQWFGENERGEYFSLNECPSWISDRDMVVRGFENGQNEVFLGSDEVVKVLVEIKRNNLPPVNLKRDILSRLKISTRSCVAQSGVFFVGGDRELSDEEIDRLNNGDEIMIEGSLANFGPSRLNFKCGDAIARYYFTNPKDRLDGVELRSLVESGVVRGEEGKDYMILEENNGQAVSLAVRVGNKRVYIPNSDQGIRVSSRSELYSVTKEVNDSTDRQDISSPFHLLETSAEMNVPAEVMGELSKVTETKDVIHLPSQLIDPGSNWVVRLEILGGKPNWVIVNFYRSNLLEKANVREKRTSFASSLKR